MADQLLEFWPSIDNLALANRGCSGQASSGITDGPIFAKSLALGVMQLNALILLTLCKKVLKMNRLRNLKMTTFVTNDISK
jgi:hypothetical protein